ncbi:hypothetical protein GY45DRAFT_687186 [Cubamyces sp. BRFM 1775]|nr:hypothetical protein GY45DRAFT_687186 [Cubamyces sp. BRFM 1775]
MHTYQPRRAGRPLNIWLPTYLDHPPQRRPHFERLISLLSDATPHNHQAVDMIVPYLQIVALTFFRFVATAHALPSGTSLEARAPDVAVGVSANLPQTRRSMPVNIMQNSDDSRPVVPVSNYQEDVGRLVGGQQ